MLDLSESGRQIAEKLFVLLDGKQRQDFMCIRQREPAKIVSRKWKLTIVSLRGLNVVLHEGNGRTQRVFLSQLARHAGYVIDFACVDPDDLMIATIQAAGGVDDFLKELFEEMISE